MPTAASNATAANTDTAPPSRRRRWLRVAGYALRTASVVFVVWICWSAATVFTSLIRDEPPAPSTGDVVEGMNAAAPLDWTEVVAAGGGWSFGDAGWTIDVRTTADAELPAAFERAVAEPATFPAQSESERAILQSLAQGLGTRRERHGGTEYAYDSPSFRFVVQTRTVDDLQRICWGRAALRRDADEWTLFEARPDTVASNTASPATPNGGRLLPYPAGTTLVATRLNAAGEVGCEFIQSPGSLDQLIAFWRGNDGASANNVVAMPSTPDKAGLRELTVVRNGRAYRVAALSESSSGTSLMIAPADAPVGSPSTSTP